uniref:Uncharacterized protein n=1 Tax=Rhizophora mucronata TaxID=61149 RepID=A0A2P2JGH2_RHIMU
MGKFISENLKRKFSEFPVPRTLKKQKQFLSKN